MTEYRVTFESEDGTDIASFTDVDAMLDHIRYCIALGIDHEITIEEVK